MASKRITPAGKNAGSTKEKKMRDKPDGSSLHHTPLSSPSIITGPAGFPVVGIGASAGGLAAFEAFFSGMPADINPEMAFVLVQHLAPDHKSLLSELVQRYTRMKVFEVEDGIEVKPNCAYIIPPNRDMAFFNGKLQLLERSAPHGQHLPIDFFFRTLAQDRHEKAICIILSGTGSDGTHGLRAVKAEGGMAMVQKPESTVYDGMPRSAIATGMVDSVLPPVEMIPQLITYVSHVFTRSTKETSDPDRKTEATLEKVFILLRSQTGHDFSGYKEKTVSRRIERRMALHQIENVDNYLRYLQRNPDETEALFRDLLIGVTSFFRDPEAFAALVKHVVSDLFENITDGMPLRIWIPGCSTGEEAYSVAIVLQEYIETLSQDYRIQLFATDIDNRAIEAARTGIYPNCITQDVSEQRLARFFTFDENEGVFQIRKKIRDMLVFSEQNLIQDPPFSRLDMISCRNLFIYLGAALQKKLIPLFHYALNPGGVLFLGTSETVGQFSELFQVLDRKAKLYKRSDVIPEIRRKYDPASHFPPLQGAIIPRLKRQTGGNTLQMREIAEHTFLQHFAPVGILVNELGDILYLHGRTGGYLEPSPGEPGMNILRMAREGLRHDLTAAVREAGIEKKTVYRHGLRVKTNGEFTTVNLTVRPAAAVAGTPPATSLLLVIFEEPDKMNRNTSATVPSADSTEVNVAPVPRNTGIIAALKKELRIKEEYLQTTIEELNSSNEEMQSINEELQSSNEELETSREELQSVNEELATVNYELQTKVADLTRTNNDMNNLLAGTGIGTIFVDNRMCIRRFTPAVTRVINLIQADIGRPVNHIVSNLVGYDHFMDDIQSVIDDLIPKEDEVRTRSGGRYLLRIQPYRTLENVIEGVVITFIDITKRPADEQGES